MTESVCWLPTAHMDALRKRADTLRIIRKFFVCRDVLEVETPLLCQSTVTDPHLASVVAGVSICGQQQKRYLQTSPEYAMKRLLAAGSGPIFQICKAFRDEEWGRRHNCEFTMLEWYRPGYDLFGLMAEIDELLQALGISGPTQRMTYEEAFVQYGCVNPFTDSDEVIAKQAAKLSGMDVRLLDRNGCLDIILTHAVEPCLGKNGPLFLWGYPPEQAALAKLGVNNSHTVALRFELYMGGVELANGYDELVDGQELRRRFEKDNVYRIEAGLPEVALDERFLASMIEGMPACSGVALGVDRLLMVMQGKDNIREVMSFSQDYI